MTSNFIIYLYPGDPAGPQLPPAPRVPVCRGRGGEGRLQGGRGQPPGLRYRRGLAAGRGGQLGGRLRGARCARGLCQVSSHPYV